MKSKCVLANVVLILLHAISVNGQSNKYACIPSGQLFITYSKTTNLIFPAVVQSIDRGSKDILVQQPKGTENIVQLKAGKPGFNQTNLSVITVDGRLYSFTVDYNSSPAQLNVIIPKQNSLIKDPNVDQTVMLNDGTNTEQYQAVAQQILHNKARHGQWDKNNGMELQLQGIYIYHDVIYFRLQLQNKSNISYSVDAIKFTIKDKQKSKRTAIQETEITPLFQAESVSDVQANSVLNQIIGLPKFTLPDSKYLSIQVLEKNGGRNLSLVLKNRKIMKAIPVKEL